MQAGHAEHSALPSESAGLSQAGPRTRPQHLACSAGAVGCLSQCSEQRGSVSEALASFSSGKKSAQLSTHCQMPLKGLVLRKKEKGKKKKKGVLCCFAEGMSLQGSVRLAVRDA